MNHIIYGAIPESLISLQKTHKQKSKKKNLTKSKKVRSITIDK